MWLLYHQSWRQQMTGNDTVLLGSSVFHYIPFLRDVAMWLGSREVTHKSFTFALEGEGKSVLVVPGGLSEVKFSKSTDNHIRILTRHKGFVRMAMKAGVPLVPIYSFGETRFLDTIDVPYLTEMFYKYLRSPFPYFRGFLGFLQIPRPAKVTVVVGAPIFFERKGHVSDEEVDAVHREFYFAVKKLHSDYKEKAGYGHETLQLVGLEADPRDNSTSPTPAPATPTTPTTSSTSTPSSSSTPSPSLSPPTSSLASSVLVPALTTPGIEQDDVEDDQHFHHKGDGDNDQNASPGAEGAEQEE